MRAYRWYAAGDVNATFGLVVDNLTNLVVLAGLLIGVFHFPADLVLYRMVPGTALGVLVGDLVYTWLARRLDPGRGHPADRLPAGTEGLRRPAGRPGRARPDPGDLRGRHHAAGPDPRGAGRRGRRRARLRRRAMGGPRGRAAGPRAPRRPG